MSTSGPDDPIVPSPPPAELGGLDPKDLLNAGLETVPPVTLPPQLVDSDVTIRVTRTPSTQAQNHAPDLPLPEELTNLLPHGNYAVASFLGQGGMGAVYKGTQIRLKRPVAIKIMRRDAGRDHDFEARFEREAQAMAKLNHPNIVSVIDFGEAGPDYLYIVMELIDGADLMDVIRDGQMTQEMALSLLPQICDALQFAHEHGIVHRDIKPSNIMVTRDGRVKMADFGLAKHFDAESSFRTQTGTGMGTPDYAAPEQFSPDSPIDHRADIYALGVMIYQMITGQLPRGVWKPPSQRAAVAPQWDAIVSRAMQSDPSDRYQQASEVKTDVSSIPLAGKERNAGTPARTQQSSGAAAKNPEADMSVRAPVKSRAPLLFGLVVGAVVILPGAFIFMKEPAPKNNETQATASAPASAPVSPDAQVSRTQVTASAIQWQKAGWTEDDLKSKTLLADSGWARIGQETGASNGWLIAAGGQSVTFQDGVVRLRYRWQGKAIILKTRNEKTFGQVRLWGPHVSLGIYLNSVETRLFQQAPLPEPLKVGDEGTLEIAAIGNRLYARLNNSIVLSSPEVPELAPSGYCAIQSENTSFRNVEYAILDGIPDPLKALGWEVPAADPIADVGWSNLMEEWERYPDRVSSLEKESVKKVTEGWRAATDSGVNATLNDPLGRDLAVRVTARFDPINLSSKTDPGFTVRARRTGPGKIPKQYTGCLFRSGKADLRVSDGNSTDWRVLKSFEMPAGFDPRQSHTIEISTQRDLISFHIDGTLIASVRDATLPPGGRFGMTGDEGILFQKAEYRYLDGVSNPTSATKEAPFVNTLGMKFVPVPITGGPTKGQHVLFSVWDTRVQDYAVFAAANPSVDSTWKAEAKNGIPVGRERDHPVVHVTWDDAKEFCRWLTAKEAAEGRLPADMAYRLPYDDEWSNAVGLPPEQGATPEAKSGRNTIDFPWGKNWPPIKNAGNYADETFHTKFLPDENAKENWEKNRWINGYTDGYATTAPVGSFPANAHGLYDMGGNVWKWCEDPFNAQRERRVLRGGSWNDTDRASLLSSARNHDAPGSRSLSRGFRIVLAPAAPSERSLPASATSASATKATPFINTLGMKFVPVPITGGPTDGQRVLFSVWETRVHDYEVFVKETRREWKKSGLVQGTTHPAVNMNCEDALAFCVWLTQAERKAGKLDAQLAYRLPSDHEWSCAVGIGDKEDAAKTPEEKNILIPVFPWGNQWPPPADAGNYGGLELKPLIDSGRLKGERTDLGEWQDAFVQTAPCGSFRESRDGLFDLGGNAFEWCNTPWSATSAGAIIRGGSTHDGQRERLFSSLRVEKSFHTTSVNLGFRCVLAPTKPDPQ